MMNDYDVFGSAISDYYHGEKTARITVHSEDFEDTFILCSQLFRTVGKLPDLEKEALVHCKGKVLDIGAGAGSHALILQEMGMEVAALEISQEATEIMTKRGVKRIINADLFYFKNEKFDTLLLLMNGIGLAGNLAGLDAFLSHLKELMNPGGIILAESSDLLFSADEEEAEAALNAEEYYGEVRYQLEYKEKLGKAFNWLYIDFESLKPYLEKHGFQAEVLFHDFEGGYLMKIWNDNLIMR